MNIKQIISLVVVVIGIALIANAKFSMDKTGEMVRKKLTGHYTTSTRTQLYSGVGMMVVGALALVYFRDHKRR